MELALAVVLSTAVGGLGCEAEAPPVFRGKPGFGIHCCADAVEEVGPGEAWLGGNARCVVYDFSIAAAELTIFRGPDSSPRLYDAPVVVRAVGDAIAVGLGNAARGNSIVLEFDGGTGAQRVVVEHPHETSGGQTILRPASSSARNARAAGRSELKKEP
jgi:hypothetical protein